MWFMCGGGKSVSVVVLDVGSNCKVLVFVLEVVVFCYGGCLLNVYWLLFGMCDYGVVF